MRARWRLAVSVWRSRAVWSMGTAKAGSGGVKGHSRREKAPSTQGRMGRVCSGPLDAMARISQVARSAARIRTTEAIAPRVAIVLTTVSARLRRVILAGTAASGGVSMMFSVCVRGIPRRASARFGPVPSGHHQAVVATFNPFSFAHASRFRHDAAGV